MNPLNGSRGPLCTAVYDYDTPEQEVNTQPTLYMQAKHNINTYLVIDVKMRCARMRVSGPPSLTFFSCSSARDLFENSPGPDWLMLFGVTDSSGCAVYANIF